MRCIKHDGAVHQLWEDGINTYIWCAVGALVGWLAGLLMKSEGKTVMIENILVGIFGAFVGGDFVVSLMNGGVVNDKVFKSSSLGMAVAGAVVLVLVVRLMRRMVGPLRAGKSKSRDRG